jgi:hypothetical protein
VSVRVSSFVFLISLVASSSSFAAATPEPSCPAGAASAQAKTADEHQLLVCLSARLSALEAKVQAIEEGKQGIGVVKLPQHADHNQRGK